jgi:hypothetical protein
VVVAREDHHRVLPKIQSVETRQAIVFDFTDDNRGQFFGNDWLPRHSRPPLSMVYARGA